MISAIFHALIYDPLYNALIFLVDVIPTHDVGLAVIALTIVVRIALAPLSKRASEAQRKMKAIAPQMEAVKQKYKDNREEQGKAIFALYRENGVHPFASVLLLLLQLPILIALYWVFALGGLPSVDTGLLYSFVGSPTIVSMQFLGFLDMSGHSIVLGALAAATQFLYTRLSMGPREKAPAGAPASFSADLSRSFDLQARYVLPATFILISFVVPNAAMLYLVTSNTFMVLQELVSGRRF
ncbi:MAG: membrane protein insertase YidC [Candidatus Kaiserbacteria bacterium]|nr:MAG: membrane protein insertase YidC [Candidatus Kaiserbacteria bacterium]